MRAVLRPLLSIVALLLPTFAHAQGMASAQASAQSGFATPQAGLGYATPQAAQFAPAYSTGCGAQAALAAPSCGYQAAALQQNYVVAAPAIVQAAPVYQSYDVQPQLQIIQRQVLAAPVYVQRQAVVVQRQAIVSPYVVQNQALASVGYGVGVGANVGVQRGLVANGLVGRQRAQRTVSRSKAVTRTGRPGILNGLLGR